MKPSVPHHIGHARAEGVGRQGRDVLDDALRPHSSSSFVPFGQNQPISAIATGIAPHTTAQGVKIEPMNRTVVGDRREKRPDRRLGRGLARCPARASVTVRDQQLAVVDAQGR